MAPAEPPRAPPAWLTGAWTGSFAGTGDPVRALILPSGACRLLNAEALGQVAGRLALGGRDLSGTGWFFLPGAARGPAAPGPPGAAPFRFEGRAAPEGSPPVRMILVNAGHAWDLATVDLARDPEAGPVPKLADLAGSYACPQTSEGSAAGLDLAADGRFTGRDPGGTFSGRLVQPDPGANALTVTLDYAPGGGPRRLAFAGLAYVRARQLVVMTDAGTSQYAGIFAPAPALPATGYSSMPAGLGR